MDSQQLPEILESLIGTPPEGLEWLAYLFSFLLVVFGLLIIFGIFKKLFSFWDR